MQPPTCTGVRIRSVRDAEVILHAVHMRILPMVTRRLDDEERLALRPGCVYVWEERSSNPLEATGQEIQRFTEGRSWGPSRAREDFLLYYEKESSSRASIYSRSGMGSQQLIKQTYSVFVDSPHNTRKWHLNAYYTQDTHDQLITVDAIPSLRGVQVPPGRYVCARTNNARRARTINKRATETEEESAQDTVPVYSKPSTTRIATSNPRRRSPTTSDSALSDGSAAFRIELAPLDYLQNVSPRSRDPVDDEALRAFQRTSVLT